MGAVPIRKVVNAAAGKMVEANQKAIDALPLNSGDWRVEGIPGLYLRCRAKTKTFRVERRMKGRLVKTTLGELPMKAAKAAAMATWSSLKPKASGYDEKLNPPLDAAVAEYMRSKGTKLSVRTRHMMQYNLDRYLDEWKGRRMADIGADRWGVSKLQQHITDKYGPATANQTSQLLSAVYNFFRKLNPDLPGNPTIVVEKHKIKPRDWAYSPDELKAWWSATGKKDGSKSDDSKEVALGVKTLSPIKRMWWLTALFTGARKGSIEALKWADVDLDKKVIKFRVAKGDRPYSIPMADKLAELFAAYRASGEVPPSEWCFPSNVIEAGHIKGVKNIRESVGPAHRLRHTYRTTLATVSASEDHTHFLMGHAIAGVSLNYVTAGLVVESMRPVTNAVAARYMEILGPLEVGRTDTNIVHPAGRNDE